MQVPQHPFGPSAQFTSLQVRWLLTMIAEALIHGFRLYESKLVPPSVDSAWIEPLIGRWAGLVAEACGLNIDDSDDDDEIDGPLKDEPWMAQTDDFESLIEQFTSVPTLYESSYDEARLAPEVWLWALQQAAVEGAYHAAALYDVRLAGDELLTLPEPTAHWFDQLKGDDWECSLPLLLPPAVDDLGVPWLTLATYEFATRTGITELMDMITAAEAANRALRFIVSERLASTDGLYQWGEAIEPLAADDFADWPVD